MNYVEAEGETIDEAIENALKILGVERDKVTVDILEEGKKGILGIGARKARVRASLRKTVFVEEGEEDLGEEAPPAERIAEGERGAAARKGEEVLSEILGLMGVHATIEVKPGEVEGEVILDVRTEDGGLLIGRRGQTLEALRHLLTRILSKSQGKEEARVIVDTESYRARRRKKLEDMALRLGEKAKRQRKTIAVEALSAADRRIIHLALQDDPWVTTKSLGKGAYRRLLIIPEGDRGDRRKKDDGKG